MTEAIETQNAKSVEEITVSDLAVRICSSKGDNVCTLCRRWRESCERIDGLPEVYLVHNGEWVCSECACITDNAFAHEALSWIFQFPIRLLLDRMDETDQRLSHLEYEHRRMMSYRNALLGLIASGNRKLIDAELERQGVRGATWDLPD